MAEDLQYHFDDLPTSIDWHSRVVTMDEQTTMDENHARLWEYCNPWIWMDTHPLMWETWQDAAGNRDAGSDRESQLTHIKKTETIHTGGNCWVDVLWLTDGTYLGVTSESVNWYKKPEDDDLFMPEDQKDFMFLCD